MWERWNGLGTARKRKRHRQSGRSLLSRGPDKSTCVSCCLCSRSQGEVPSSGAMKGWCLVWTWTTCSNSSSQTEGCQDGTKEAEWPSQHPGGPFQGEWHPGQAWPKSTEPVQRQDGTGRQRQLSLMNKHPGSCFAFVIYRCVLSLAFVSKLSSSDLSLLITN